VERKTPNILFIMSDDHASHAMSCYGSKINKTPNLDRIADGGMIFNNSFCTNSISTPSRAAILTGTYNHINKVTTLDTKMDNCLQTFPKLLHGKGYQTAIFGKWHLGTGPEHCPTGFDNWAVLPGQGLYHNPDFIFKGPGGGEKRVVKGYATDIITDMSLDWLKKRDIKRPFCLLCHHKAPHRHWEPDEKHARLYLDKDIPEPETLYDDYSNRSSAASEATLRIGRDMNEKDLKCEINRNLSEKELRKWAYQRYIKDYLRVIASVDDNVGRILDYLDEEGLTENTIVVYASDQGFFLGDHGWFDKRFMYEESIKMPFIIRYPKEIKPGSVNDNMILNVDYAETFLDYAEIDIPSNMQGRSFRPLLNGELPEDWQTSMYYRYWMHCGGHNVYAHYGVRTLQHKLIYYYSQALGQEGTVDDPKVPEWELFDLKKDPHEMENIYNKPEYKEVTENLKEELHHLQQKVKDIGVAE
jgi:arylsulfatase A-like enzyme